MEKINIAGLVNDSITDGPGIRYTVVVQGCPPAHTVVNCLQRIVRPATPEIRFFKPD